MKRNFGCWMLSHHLRNFETFWEKSKAAVEHHFNNHAHCGDWCAMKKAAATQAAIRELKLRCKKNDKKMHEDTCQVMDCSTATDKLKERH